MPRKYTKSKKSKKIVKIKRNRYRRYPANLRNNVMMGLGFPNKSVMKHRYYDTYVSASTTGAIDNNNYVLNGLYRPYAANARSVSYFSQMSAIYNHYQVIGAKVTVKLVASETGTPVPLQAVVWQNDDTTVTPTNFYSLAESSKAKKILLSLHPGRPATAVLKYSAKKTFGTGLDVDSLRGSATANPTETSICSVSVQSTDGTSTSSYVAQVMIEYIAVWTELKDIEFS